VTLLRACGRVAGRVAGWVLLVAMLAVLANRLHGGSALLVQVQAQALTGLLLLPAPLLLALAWWRGRRALAVAAVVPSLALAVWALDAAGLSRGEPAGDPLLRVATANLALDNPRVEDAAAALLAEDPQVVVLQEVTPGLWSRLATTPLARALPHHVVDAREGYHGSAVLSATPVTGEVRALGHGDVLETRVDVGGTTAPTTPTSLLLVDVHVPAPVPANGTGPWSAHLAELEATYAARPGVLLAGDFNATADHAALRQVLDGGLRDAWDEAGRGLGGTFPHRGALPSVLRLDHVLVGSGLVATEARTVDLPGSDHRALVADVGRAP